MEVNKVIRRITGTVWKYRYAAGILLIGIVLMLLPTGKTAEKTTVEPSAVTQTQPSAEERLGNILSKIQGAGKVEVVLSVSSGAETRYHENRDTDSDSAQTDTVILTDADKNQTALVSRVDPPVYLGAIVVCQGADSASVRLAIVDAVSKYTGLGADHISVLKMK